MKKIMAFLSALFLACEIFAYNPPFGGEEIFRLTSPELMRGADSATGGPDFTVIPASIVYNPALPAGEQRVDVDLSGTLFFNLDKISGSDDGFGGGFQAGLMIPTKWSVFSFTTSALFADFYGMNLRKTVIMHGGASKDVTENFFLGANVYTGFYMGSGSDFSVGVDLGALYKIGELGVLKSSRMGFSFLNLGKPADYEALGIDGTYGDSSYPGMFTPRISFAADFLEAGKSRFAFSTDFSFPSFQNFVADFALGFNYDNFLRISASWQANVREIAEGKADGISYFSLGASFRIGIRSKKISEKNADWEQSEFVPCVAVQNLYSGIQAVSLGARIDLGMRDTDAPEIYLWDEK